MTREKVQEFTFCLLHSIAMDTKRDTNKKFLSPSICRIYVHSNQSSYVCFHKVFIVIKWVPALIPYLFPCQT